MGSTPTVNADYSALRRLTAAAAPDLELFWAILDRTRTARKQPAERRVYNKACARYRELTTAR